MSEARSTGQDRRVPFQTGTGPDPGRQEWHPTDGAQGIPMEDDGMDGPYVGFSGYASAMIFWHPIGFLCGFYRPPLAQG